jgi:hypothetical protein
VRARFGGLAALAVTALLAGGCAAPAGLDGDLTDDWKGLPEARIPVPRTGACYDVPDGAPKGTVQWPEPVDCAAAHTVETVHIGTFEGGDPASVPGQGSPERRSAYTDCAGKAKEFLGDDWRTGRLDLVLVLPIQPHWQAGARWYRCDLVEYQDVDDFKVVQRSGSLRDGLTGARPVGLGCVAVTETAQKRVDRLAPTPCETPHNGEFAAVVDLPEGAYPTDPAAAGDQRLRSCAGPVAAFVGVPDDTQLADRIGWVASPFSEIDWGLGNRGVRCYAYSGDPLVGSVRGAGPEKLPPD